MNKRKFDMIWRAEKKRHSDERALRDVLSLCTRAYMYVRIAQKSTFLWQTIAICLLAKTHKEFLGGIER